MSRKSMKWNRTKISKETIFFSVLQNDDLPDDLKPDVQLNCEEDIELPKKKKNKIKSRKRPAKKTNKSKDSTESINDDVPNQKLFAVANDSSSEVASTKNSKTKGKKEKVGKMCQICGQIFKSLQAHLYVHDIYPKFECAICNKKFRHKANVLSHMKIHTNQR